LSKTSVKAQKKARDFISIVHSKKPVSEILADQDQNHLLFENEEV